MKKLIVLLLMAVLAAPVFSEPPRVNIPIGIPRLALDADWPEKHLPHNLINKTRPPRGGTFDVVAILDYENTRPLPTTISLAGDGKLAPFKATLNGKTLGDPLGDIKIRRPTGSYEIRWTFAIPWNIGQADSEYDFTVTATPTVQWSNGQYGPLKKSVTIEPGISCYDTTYAERLKMLALSKYCKLETIGKSLLGRDMYLLRVTDFSVPAKDKRPLVIIGPYHGNEPSGTESILDFVYELTTMPANADYLKKVSIYIVPCMSPDNREIGTWLHVDGTNMNHAYDPDKRPPEALNTAAALQKYKSELVGAIAIVDHQGGHGFSIAHECAKIGDWSHRLARDVCVQVSNQLDQRVPLYSRVDDDNPYHTIRGYMFHELGIPNFVLENGEQDTYNIGKLFPTMHREMLTYYATLDFLCGKPSPAPKQHPTTQVAFPSERNYSVYKIDVPLVLDGKLDDACWQDVPAITTFTTADLKAEPVAGMSVKLAYDDKYLYIAMSAADLQASSFTGRDAAGSRDEAAKFIWNTDGIDIVLDTNLNQWSYYQFIVNASGGSANHYYPLPAVQDFVTFDPAGCKSAGSVKDGVIELAIPFTAFNGHPDKSDPPVSSPPTPGTVWGANFSRNEHDGKPGATWAKLGTDSHAPWKFNAITFMGSKSNAKKDTQASRPATSRP